MWCIDTGLPAQGAGAARRGHDVFAHGAWDTCASRPLNLLTVPLLADPWMIRDGIRHP